MPAAKPDESSRQRKSHDALIDQAGFSVERLPMLGVAFEQFVAGLIDSLRRLGAASTSLSLKGLATASLFELLRSSAGSLAAVLHCSQWDARALVIVDPDFVSVLVDLLLGGDASEPPQAASRAFTTIEYRLMRTVAELAAKALGEAFAGLVEATFELERQETLADVNVLGRRDAPVVAARILLQAGGVGGAMTVVVPQAALAPIRQKLAREAPEEPAVGDPRWTRQMQTGVSHAEISLKGVLEEIPMTLGEVSQLHVGQVLALRGSGMGRVRLECGEYDLFWCKLAQADGRYTLEIEEPIVEHGDVLDDILAA